MGQSAAQKAQAKKLTAKRKLNEAADEVMRAREAAKDLEITSVEDWKAGVDRHPVKLAMPSGKVCLAFNPGMEVFVEQGIIPNALLPLVMKAVEEGKGMDPKAVSEAAKDPELLAQTLEMCNAITVRCVIQPVVHPIPKAAERSAKKLYVDEVDLDDRMFLMQWVVGGTSNLGKFRDEQEAVVGGLQPSEDMEREA